MFSRRYEIEMTKVPVMSGLVSFFIPLMISGLLQLLFNAVDLVVVGRFTGSDALAAVGATSSLINMFINLLMGVSLGVNVLTARYIACRDDEKTEAAVHTAILFAFLVGLGLLVFGMAFARPALGLMGTPEGVIGLSTLYMRIYFCGMPFFMVYNYGAAVLRAAGDTQRPLFFLLIAGVLNAGLNLFLVIVFQLGVAGVAIATVFSQMVSCLLVVGCLCRSQSSYRLNLRHLRIEPQLLLRMLKLGLPCGAQSMVISFSNVLLQSSVNSFGALAMAGYTACNNIMSMFYACINSITQACMTFTSQNYAVHNFDRMKRIVRDGMLLETILCLIMGIGCYLIGPQLLSIYNSSAEVIGYGMEIALVTYPTYILCGYMDCLPGFMRGMGNSTIPMLLSLLGTVGTRIVWILFFFPLHRSLGFLFISYPLSWLIAAIMQGVCLALVSRRVYHKAEGELL